jgi:hypothetical protein
MPAQSGAASDELTRTTDVLVMRWDAILPSNVTTG